jgi:hypothetical protein
MVHEYHIHRGTIGVTDAVPIRLESGWNRLMIKIENVVSGWGFFAKITDADKKVMDDLSYSVDPEVDITANVLPRTPVDSDCIIDEKLADTEVEFTTTCPGKPHIIKVSYYPNWKVEGAEKIYLVTPSFMLVYPEGEHVRLRYGNTTSDNVGLVLTLAGLLIIAFLIAKDRGWLKLEY